MGPQARSSSSRLGYEQVPPPVVHDRPFDLATSIQDAIAAIKGMEPIALEYLPWRSQPGNILSRK